MLNCMVKHHLHLEPTHWYLIVLWSSLIGLTVFVKIQDVLELFLPIETVPSCKEVVISPLVMPYWLVGTCPSAFKCRIQVIIQNKQWLIADQWNICRCTSTMYMYFIDILSVHCILHMCFGISSCYILASFYIAMILSNNW